MPAPEPTRSAPPLPAFAEGAREVADGGADGPADQPADHAPARAPSGHPAEEAPLALRRAARRARKLARAAEEAAAQVLPLSARAGPVPVALAPKQLAPQERPPQELASKQLAPPPAARARWGLRHSLVLLSFLVLVLAPLAGLGWYLWARAADRYATDIAFTIRGAAPEPAVAGLSGGLTALTGAAMPAAEGDILHAYLTSRELVARLDAAVGLRARLARAHGRDPLFSLAPEGPVDELLRHWERLLRISHDPGSGLIVLEVQAFTPADAEAIGAALLAESERMINALGDAARAEATRHAAAALAEAGARLAGARAALAAFRARTGMVDPAADIGGRMGVLGALQAQLAEALIARDLLAATTTRADDPRLGPADQRLEAIRARLAEERESIAAGGVGPDAGAYVARIAEFERLAVEVELAQAAYGAALAADHAARAESARKARHLAAFVHPALPESSAYPRRWMILGLAGLFLALLWAVAVLATAALRDRA